MPNEESIDERVTRLLRTGEATAIHFVFVGLTTGIASCQIARKRRESPGPDYSRSVERAQTALKTAERFMWRFRMKHPDFDQMTALAERLRMELAELDPPQE